MASDSSAHPDDLLLAVPNVSEGQDTAALQAIGEAFTSVCGVRLLDIHRDPDHHRSVFTLAGASGTLAAALAQGANEALQRIAIGAHRGAHPRVGALDVAPVVHLDAERRGAACAEALVAADELSRLGLPVFLYGALAGGRTRAELRRGGLAELMRHVEPDFGPHHPHPRGGAVLVAARPPLVAFNVELAPPADLAIARDVAARIREGGPEGLPGVRAIGLELTQQGRVQVSTNVEDHLATPLARVVEAVGRHARVAGAELVGLAPRAALDGFPADVELRGFHPARHVIEEALSSL